jgi:benzoate 4-monooxygenase
LDKYPGPFLAKFSRLWLARQAGRGNRFEVVHELHKKHGKSIGDQGFLWYRADFAYLPHLPATLSATAFSLCLFRSHKGKFVRIAPDHISISSPSAIPVVYGHGTGFTKADFYDAFVSIRRGLFNTRDRKEHTRKRKIVSHVFSQVSWKPPEVEINVKWTQQKKAYT